MDDLLSLYRRGSDWAVANVAGATDKLQAQTPCDQWNGRTLMSHVLDTQRYFCWSRTGRGSSSVAEPTEHHRRQPGSRFSTGT